MKIKIDMWKKSRIFTKQNVNVNVSEIISIS